MLKKIYVVLTVILVSHLVGCATQFNESNINSLYIGMSSNVVREIFGTPSGISSSVCGSATPSGAWICEKWKYETLSGMNEFTFSVKPEGKFLNSWNVNR
jgi:hypothetical protein